MSPTHDLFLSYRWIDQAAVAPLLDALAARGIQVWQDAREVDDLASIQKAVSTGLARSRAMLAWYTGRYNASRACQWELTSAYLAAQAEGDPRRRILIVNPGDSPNHIHLPELFDQLHLSGAGLPGDAAAVAALADRIQAALAQVPATALGELRPLTPQRWLPVMGMGSNRFVGRLREMWQLHQLLQTSDAAMLTGAGGKPGLAVVRGAGGIGKSLLAEEYALRFGAAYPGGVFWLRAYGHPDNGADAPGTAHSGQREAQLIDLAQGLGLDTSGLTEPQVRGLLQRHLAAQGQPFLWVVDDLPPQTTPTDLAHWQAPHPLGRTLYTTRTRRLTHVAALDLPQLDADDARHLLTRGRPLSAAEATTADAICTLLGCHALAVDVTAALVERRGLAQVLRKLQHPRQDTLALAAELDEALPNGHQRHIAATFLASIEQLQPAAHQLLRYAAVLAVAPIPMRLLAQAVAAAQGQEPDDARDAVDIAVSQLLASGLADDSGSQTISVHTLVSRTLRFAETAPEPWATLRAQVLAELAAEMPRARDIRQHADLQPWVAHARELCQPLETEAQIALLGWVARFDFERASYALAQAGYERELAARQRIQGAEHPNTLTSMNNLALTLQAQGDLGGARQLQETELAARQRILGAEHPATLTSMNNLSETLVDQGDLSGARQLQETVLAACQRTLGAEHPDTLSSMNNLASTLWNQGDLGGARQLQETVLAALQRILGAEHPATLTSKNNLASTLKAQGDLGGARQHQETVLAARQRILGAEHPATLTSMNNLAGTLWNLGDLGGARQLEETVLAVSQRILGAEHPDTLSYMSNLASTLQAQGDLSGARQLKETVLAARQRILGAEHPDTLSSMNNLADTRWQLGEHAAAMALQTAAVDGAQRTLGVTHPTTLAIQDNLEQMQAALSGKPPSA